MFPLNSFTLKPFKRIFSIHFYLLTLLLNLIQSVFSLYHSAHLHVSKSSEHLSELILFDSSWALESNTSFLLTPQCQTPWRQDFLDLLISLSLRFCLICRICIRQRPLSTGISEDIALTIISLHFPPYPRFQKASTYRCGTKFNLSPRPLRPTSAIPLTDPLESTWPGLNLWAMMIPQACPQS